MNIHIKNCYIKKYVRKNPFYRTSKKHVIPLWRNNYIKYTKYFTSYMCVFGKILYTYTRPNQSVTSE